MFCEIQLALPGELFSVLAHFLTIYQKIIDWDLNGQSKERSTKSTQLELVNLKDFTKYSANVSYDKHPRKLDERHG